MVNPGVVGFLRGDSLSEIMRLADDVPPVPQGRGPFSWSAPAKYMGLLVISLLAASCWTEGNSYFLADGETERFLTMNRCEREATAKHPEGTSKYSGYECRGKFLGLTTTKRDYYNGKLQSETR